MREPEAALLVELSVGAIEARPPAPAPSPHYLLVEIVYQVYNAGPGKQHVPADASYHSGTRSFPGQARETPSGKLNTLEKRVPSEKLLVVGPRAGTSFREGMKPEKEPPIPRGVGDSCQGMRGLYGGEAMGLCAFGGGAEVECGALENLEEGAPEPWRCPVSGTHWDSVLKWRHLL